MFVQLCTWHWNGIIFYLLKM